MVILRAEIGVAPQMTLKMLQFVYHAFGKYIDETNAAAVFDRWGDYMRGRSLRLQITVQQTAKLRTYHGHNNSK